MHQLNCNELIASTQSKVADRFFEVMSICRLYWCPYVSLHYVIYKIFRNIVNSKWCVIIKNIYVRLNVQAGRDVNYCNLQSHQPQLLNSFSSTLSQLLNIWSYCKRLQWKKAVFIITLIYLQINLIRCPRVSLSRFISSI